MCEGGDVRNELDGTLNYFLTISEGFVTGFVYPPSGKKDFIAGVVCPSVVVWPEACRRMNCPCATKTHETLKIRKSIHIDRIACGDCYYRNFSRASIADTGRGKT